MHNHIDKIRTEIRRLAHMLASEESEGIYLSEHNERKALHNMLLEKLYHLEKRVF
jgi:hypothetical protein